MGRWGRYAANDNDDRADDNDDDRADDNDDDRVDDNDDDRVDDNDDDRADDNDDDRADNNDDDRADNNDDDRADHDNDDNNHCSCDNDHNHNHREASSDHYYCRRLGWRDDHVGAQRVKWHHGWLAAIHRHIADGDGAVGIDGHRLWTYGHSLWPTNQGAHARDAMTAVTFMRRSGSPRRFALSRSTQGVTSTTRGDVPPLSPRMQLVRACLVLLFALTATLLLQLMFVSSLQSRAGQRQAFTSFRAELANGTAPIGPTTEAGRVLALGTPVAFIEIPSIGLRQVVGEGTAASELLHGPGHRRDTPLPGQVGTSVVFGRRAAFGGPFSRIAELTKGAEIKVTTGQGADFTFRVIAVRRDGDPAPAAAARGTSRLTLVTAAGRAFFPEGVLRVDADLEGQAVVGPARLISASGLPAPERLMAGDTRTLWALALWLQALIALSIGAVWAWHRWGRVQTWIVFLPALLLVGLCVSGEAARLLPNLL